jgi:hypothetical protein
MANGVAARAVLPFSRNRTGAFTSIAPVGLHLPERSH